MKKTDKKSSVKDVTIVVNRHPEKDKAGNITPYGAQQAFAAAQQLKEMSMTMDRFYGSGLDRTFQAALVMAAILIRPFSALKVESHLGFNFTDALDKSYAGDSQGFLNEMAELKKAGHITIETTRNAGSNRFKKYIQLASDNLQAGMFEIAKDMITNNQSAALALSHSPYTELCSIDPANTPLGLGESDAIVYVLRVEYEESVGEIIEFGNITMISSTLVKAPLAGKTN